MKKTGKKFKKGESMESLKQTLQEAEILGARWLYYGNLASERGDRELAERHYARGQKWHDRMNKLDSEIFVLGKDNEK